MVTVPHFLRLALPSSRSTKRTGGMTPRVRECGISKRVVVVDGWWVGDSWCLVGGKATIWPEVVVASVELMAAH